MYRIHLFRQSQRGDEYLLAVVPAVSLSAREGQVADAMWRKPRDVLLEGVGS